VRDTTLWGEARKYNSGLEGSQAVPARPSCMGNVHNRFFKYAAERAALLRFELKLGAILGRNFDATIGRAACEACSATNSAFALGSRKSTETLDRVGRSQDLPNAN
jgi:hypothetical protein